MFVGKIISDGEGFLDWRAAAIDSRVGIEVSSLGEGGGEVAVAKN